MHCKSDKSESKQSSEMGLLSQAEQQEIDCLCAPLSHDEISFDEWCDQHSQLDLQIPLTITREQLTSSFRATIKLTRTIRTSSAQGQSERREKILKELVIEPSKTGSDKILIKGLGDIQDEKVGNLLILIQIKD
ncbi:MAG: hypothetical protein NTX25_07270 [Proteobacteria bacterium]|nr:hypothetical protein [Pseudomonadota bacterium]